LQERVDATINLVDEWGVSWIVWCGLNEEAEMIASALPNAVNVQGSDSYSSKRGAIESFLSGKIKVLVTKAKIAGFGLNFQHCSHMVFLGISDSYETYYQCIRRCWRFGQKKPVHAHIVVSEAEQAVANAYRDGRFLRNPQVTVTVEVYAVREISVQGQVKSPQRVVLAAESSMTVLEAITKCGGFTDSAKGTEVRVTRVGPDGKVKVFTVDIDSLIKGKGHARAEDDSLLLMPGDIIYVPERLI
jgi:superfamily II DNA/RNA helicase